jgi:hypothetical protein
VHRRSVGPNKGGSLSGDAISGVGSISQECERVANRYAVTFKRSLIKIREYHQILLAVVW